jgi:hypothetical protein
MEDVMTADGGVPKTNGTNRREVVRWFRELPYHEKKEMLRVLGLLMPRPKCHLICDADVSSVGIILKYCTKHQIVYDVKRLGRKKVKFTFADQTIRNQVMIGIRTL